LHEHLWLIGYRHRIGGVHVERSDRALDLFRELRYTVSQKKKKRASLYWDWEGDRPIRRASVMNACADLSVPIHLRLIALRNLTEYHVDRGKRVCISCCSSCLACSSHRGLVDEG
jgi:hypothetical protein